MPRKPRFSLPDIPVHIVHRGHSCDPVFFENQDYATYAYWLNEAAERYSVAVHAFVFMTNHIHLLATPSATASISSFMQYIGRRYVPYMNHKYGKSGSIWEGRYKASLVQSEGYLLNVMRYIELNPVRAGMVKSPSHYRWSSFCHNTGLRAIKLISPHPVYLTLGRSDKERHAAYAALFHSHLGGGRVQQITAAWLTGTPLGSDYFREKVETTLSRKVGHVRRGRPCRHKSEAGKVKGL